MGLSSAEVCLLGMGIVFFGLVCIVIICSFMSLIVRKFTNTDNTAPDAVSTAAPATPMQSTTGTALPAEEKRAVVAGICAVIAEELGTDVKNIRVLSFKRV